MGLDQYPAIEAAYAPGDGTKRTKIVLADILNLAQGVREAHRLPGIPALIRNDDASLKLLATTDSPATVLMEGFPNILNPGQMLLAGLSDGHKRERTSQVTLTFPTNLYGSEKASQWYAALAVSGLTTDFFLIGVPYLRVKSQALQVISLGTNLTPATGIGYGWTADQFADGSKLYMLTGASAGLMRPILHNNTDNANGGTVEYSGDALSLAAGDYFIILPAVNFRRLGDVFNDAAGNITQVDDLIFGKGPYEFMAPGTFTWTCPLIWDAALATGSGGGGGGAGASGNWSNPHDGGGAGVLGFKVPVAPTPGTIYTITIGAYGAAGTPPSPGGNTSLGPLLTLAGGAINVVPGFTVLDYNNQLQGFGGLGQLGFGGLGNGGNGDFGTGTHGTAGFLIIERAV